MSKYFLAALMTAPFLACATQCAAQGSLAPDLSVRYTCSADPPTDSAIETFLKAHGFDVANPERVRRQLAAGFFPMDIEAIDRRQWTIEFRGINDNPDPLRTPATIYTLGVYSPPPTVHDTALERAVIAFVSAQTGCTLGHVEHSENPSAAAGTFDFTVKARRSRMHEAAICDQTERTYDEQACRDVPGVKDLLPKHP